MKQAFQCRFDSCTVHSYAVPFDDGLAPPTWNASVPFLVGGSGADMNSVVSYFTEDVSLQIITTELPARVAIQKAHFAGNIIKVRP